VRAARAMPRFAIHPAGSTRLHVLFVAACFAGCRAWLLSARAARCTVSDPRLPSRCGAPGFRFPFHTSPVVFEVNVSSAITFDAHRLACCFSWDLQLFFRDGSSELHLMPRVATVNGVDVAASWRAQLGRHEIEYTGKAAVTDGCILAIRHPAPHPGAHARVVGPGIVAACACCALRDWMWRCSVRG
jgi:hypothetical protein